jgi:surface protein
MSSGVRYNSGRQRFLGPILETELPITLDPQQYTGAIVYANDGNLYFSNGVDWVIPVDRVPIARPIGLSPTTPTQQAQLRLNAYFSAIDLPQTGAYFEVSLTESFTSPLFTRTLTGEGIFQYQMLYPEDGIEPGTTFYWRGRYVSGAEQSAFSIPIQQTFPDLIAQPTQISPAGSIQGAVTISDYESPFGLIFVQTEVEFYDETGVTLLETVTDTTFGVNQFTIPATLTEGTTYTWRARRGGKIGLDGATQFSPWTGKRAVVNGARSIVLTYDTALMSARTIGVPLAGTVNCTINWGDGLSDTYTTAGVNTHTYDVAVTGTVTVTISGTLTTWGGQTGITAAQQQGLTRVESIGFQLGLTSMANAFRNTSANLVYISPNLPPTITNLSNCFQLSASNVSSITEWDTSNVTNMSNMFLTASAFNRPIGSWNVSKVTNMSNMFKEADSFNQPLNNWDTSSVTNMSEMFRNTIFNQNIGAWNVSNVTNMNLMFLNAPAFNNGGSPDINNWNTLNVTNMSGMFQSANSFNQPIGNWNVSKVTTMASMFFSSGSMLFNQDLSNWNCDACTIMSNMFSRSTRGSGPNPILQSATRAWYTPEVTTCEQMFWNNTSFNRDISLWELPKCTNISRMFSTNNFNFADNSTSNTGPTPILQNGSNVWKTPLASNASGLFAANTSFNGDLSLWDTSGVTDMSWMFAGTLNFDKPIGDWDTSNVTNMSRMFGIGASASITMRFNQPIETWDVSNVTNMAYMFGANGAAGFTRIHLFNQPLNNWNVSKVTNMQGMFGAAAGNNSFDSRFNQPIGNWDVSSVTDMSRMFAMRAFNSPEVASYFNQDISGWKLNEDVVLTSFMSGSFGRAFDSSNYSKLLAGWASYIATQNGPYARTTEFSGVQYTNTTVLPGERFTTGEAGRTFLTTARGVVVSDADDPDGDGVYTFDAGSSVYTNTNNWYFVKTSGSWKLYDNNDVLQATGTGDVATPWQSTAWDGDLEFADVLNNGTAWTITDGGLL